MKLESNKIKVIEVTQKVTKKIELKVVNKTTKEKVTKGISRIILNRSARLF